jgi:6-pyruvoyltetrahydropterin/6-carboxytetrahydropterin synthase
MSKYIYSVCKEMEIAGAHRLSLPYESKCANFHGHNWKVKVWCRANALNGEGMVCDFTHIKRAIHDKLDHQCLNDIFDFNPTAENMARWMLEQIPSCYKVSVQESEGNVAVCEKDEG